MATKDWKKVGTNAFESLRYKNKKNNQIIRVLNSSANSFIFDVSSSNGGWNELKDFKTKAKALKFARSYMRSH